jgi:hypothetical protein
VSQSQLCTHSQALKVIQVLTLQQVFNSPVNDNGKTFMSSADVPGKQEAVSVTRQDRIKTKGTCTLDPLGQSCFMFRKI